MMTNRTTYINKSQTTAAKSKLKNYYSITKQQQ